MAILTVDQLKEGMVLDAPVKNATGQMLFPEGATLSEKHISMMKAWGINDADVQLDEKDNEDAALFREKCLEAEKTFLARFHLSDCDDSIVQEMISVCAVRYVTALMKST